MNENMQLNLDGSAAMPIVVAVWVLAAILKNAFEKFPNRLIPLVTWGLAGTAYVIVTRDFTPQGVIAGILTSAVATGVHSGLKNSLPPAKPEEPQ